MKINQQYIPKILKSFLWLKKFLGRNPIPEEIAVDVGYPLDKVLVILNMLNELRQDNSNTQNSQSE